GGFKQGHRDGGKYYGEYIWEYLQIAKTIADPATTGGIPIVVRPTAPAAGEVDLDGFVFLVERLYEERIPPEPPGYFDVRTAGKYSAFFNRLPIDGLGGMAFEQKGKGDNGRKGHAQHLRLEAGTYPLWTHAGGHYMTWSYGETRTDHIPRPGLL